MPNCVKCNVQIFLNVKQPMNVHQQKPCIIIGYWYSSSWCCTAYCSFCSFTEAGVTFRLYHSQPKFTLVRGIGKNCVPRIKSLMYCSSEKARFAPFDPFHLNCRAADFVRRHWRRVRTLSCGSVPLYLEK